MSKKGISIITVCFNCEDLIENTILSVLRQTSNQYEFIIVDGKSTDNTLTVIKKYIDFFGTKNVEFKLISEKDTGIYNAMNKGLALSTYDWVYFLNGGDTFYSDDVIEKVSKKIDEYGMADVIYGSINTQCFGQERISYPRELSTFNRKMPFCHQGVFAKREIMLNNQFDEKYKIIADYKMFYELYLKKYIFKEIDITIANYSLNGKSGSNSLTAYKESICMKKELDLELDSIYVRIPKYFYHFFLDKTSGIRIIKKFYINKMFKREEL